MAVRLDVDLWTKLAPVIMRAWQNSRKRGFAAACVSAIRKLGVRIPSRARDEPFGAFHTGRLFFLLPLKRDTVWHMSKVFLLVEVNVKPGQFDEFVSKLKSHIAVIRTEAGCEFIDIYRDTQKPDVVNVWEIWTDRPSWDAHMVNANSKAWQAVGPNYVFGETITVMDAL